VTTAQALGGKGENMSSVTIEADKPAATAQPEPETMPKKPAKGTKPTKKAKAAKKGKATAEKAGAKPATDRTNKKAEVIAMMKRSKGATLAEIQEATGWQKHYADVGIRNILSGASSAS
jgi:hypothetical protein